MTPVDPAVLRRKLMVIVENLTALESVISLPSERYHDDLFIRKGTERLLQELIEAAIDVNAHLLVQQGHPPPDDYYQGFLKLAEHAILSRDLATALAPSTELRNRLVHEYDTIVDAMILEAVKKSRGLISEICGGRRRIFEELLM